MSKQQKVKKLLEGISGDIELLDNLALSEYSTLTTDDSRFLVIVSELLKAGESGKWSSCTKVDVATALLSAGLHNAIHTWLDEPYIPELNNNELYAWRLCENAGELLEVYREANKNRNCGIRQRVKTKKHENFPGFVWTHASSYVRAIYPLHLAERRGFKSADVLLEFLTNYSEDELLDGKTLSYGGNVYKLTLQKK